MPYETLNCSDTTCPFQKKGACKFNAFDELPCQELSYKEFEELLLNMKEVYDD